MPYTPIGDLFGSYGNTIIDKDNYKHLLPNATVDTYQYSGWNRDQPQNTYGVQLSQSGFLPSEVPQDLEQQRPRNIADMDGFLNKYNPDRFIEDKDEMSITTDDIDDQKYLEIEYMYTAPNIMVVQPSFQSM